jgi:ribosomal protein L37AE/L43A
VDGRATDRQRRYLANLGFTGDAARLSVDQARAKVDELLAAERASGKRFACPSCAGVLNERPTETTTKCPHCKEKIVTVLGALYTKAQGDEVKAREFAEDNRRERGV